MADADTLGIGLVGLNIGQQHLEGYRRKGIRPVALCDLDASLLARTAERFGIPATYRNVYEMIADPRVQIVDVALQPWTRWPVVAAAAEAGKHVLSQKPFAHNLKQAVGMVEACERHGVQLMVNQNSCFVPGFLAIEPYMTPETLGDIYYVTVTSDGWVPSFPERHVIPAMMIHHLALVHKWFGPIAGVFCQAHGHHRSVAEGELMATLQLRFASGVQGLLVNNWSFLGRTGHTHPHPQEEIRIQGTKGTICGHSEQMTVHVTEPMVADIQPEIRGTWFPDAFGNVMVHFQECIRAGKKPITDGRGNLHLLQTVFACYRSIEEQRMVSPEEIALDGNYDVSPGRVLGPDERAL